MKQSRAIDNFWELRRRADMFYAYSYIHAYIQDPVRAPARHVAAH